jgi:hypothetical protein
LSYYLNVLTKATSYLAYIMRLKVENIKENPVTLLRRAGYVFQHKEQDKMSFVRPLARGGYPRFHIHAHLEDVSLVISLHLDQKKETYGAVTRHHGEYEDEGALQAEANRIKPLLG